MSCSSAVVRSTREVSAQVVAQPSMLNSIMQHNRLLTLCLQACLRSQRLEQARTLDAEQCEKSTTETAAGELLTASLLME